MIIPGQSYVMELYEFGSVCLVQKTVNCLSAPLEFGLGQTSRDTFGKVGPWQGLGDDLKYHQISIKSDVY